MKSSQQTVTFKLKDGQSTLATWQQHVEKLPTIGESIALEQDQPNYARNASVLQIEHDGKTSEISVILEAQPLHRDQPRTVVFLNSDYIPESLRHAAEEAVRKSLELPLIEWVHSFETKPITQVHPLEESAKNALETLNESLRELVASTLDVEFVKA